MDHPQLAEWQAKNAEYERRRRVWRFVIDAHGPIEPPTEQDLASWVNPVNQGE